MGKISVGLLFQVCQGRHRSVGLLFQVYQGRHTGLPLPEPRLICRLLPGRAAEHGVGVGGRGFKFRGSCHGFRV